MSKIIQINGKNKFYGYDKEKIHKTLIFKTKH